MQLHQASVGRLVEQVVLDPTGGGLKRVFQFTSVGLPLREAVEHGIRLATPAFALQEQPVLEVWSIRQREARPGSCHDSRKPPPAGG